MQIAEHVKPEVEKIDAQQDASTYFLTVQDQSPPDPPVYCAFGLAVALNSVPVLTSVSLQTSTPLSASASRSCSASGCRTTMPSTPTCSSRS